MEQQLEWLQFKEEWLADIVQGNPSNAATLIASNNSFSFLPRFSARIKRI